MNKLGLLISTSRSTDNNTAWDLPNKELTKLDASTPEPQNINNLSFSTDPILKASVSTSISKTFLTTTKTVAIIMVGTLLIGSIVGLGVSTYFYSNNVGITPKVGYGKSCASNQCNDTQALSCISGICQCDSTSSYWNLNISACYSLPLSYIQHGGYCQQGYTQCLNATQCLNSICQCNSTSQFWTGSTCTPKLNYSSACGLSNSNNCVSDDECIQCTTSSLLYCDTTFGNCSCTNDSYYDSGLGKCTKLKSYFTYCSSSSQCDSTLQHFNTQTANCPSVSILNYCDCPYGQYYDQAYNKCYPKKGFNRPCSQSCECDSNRGLACYAGICSCPQYTYFNSTACVATKTGYYNSTCKSNTDCNTDLGLICSNVSICDCVLSTNYYWSTTLKLCVSCPDGWVIWRSSNNISRCYYISNSQADWTNASLRCTNDNAYLLPIKDYNEYILIYNYFSAQTTYKWYHIGVYANDGYNWYRSDGTFIGSGYGCWFLSNPPSYFLPSTYNSCTSSCCSIQAVTMYTGPSTVLANTYYTSNNFYAYYICRKILV